MTVPLRAALYLRVSTARQAEHDVSIPDQRKQGEAYCAARGYQLVETFVDAGASATNDRRPEFQQMIEAGTAKPAPFEVVVVHSFSRFFRDHFELEFDVRKRLYDAIESGVADLDDPDLRDRIASLKAIRDQSRVDSDRAYALLESAGQKAITASMLATFAQAAGQRMRLPGGGYRRDHLRALTQRVEIAEGEVCTMGSKSDLLRTLAAAAGSGTLPGAVPSFVPKWRKECPSNHSLSDQ
jgi:hypothetical protein